MISKNFPFVENDDGDELYSDDMISDTLSQYYYKKERLSSPNGMVKISDTPERQLDYMIGEYNKLIIDFNRLCSIVTDLQETIRHLSYHCEDRFYDIEHELSKHCSGFHSALIITDKRKNEEKNESNIP